MEIEITKNKLRDKDGMSGYFGSIFFDTIDGKHSKVLISVSEKYFRDKFNTKNPTNEYLNSWYDQVSSKWEKLGEKIFDKNEHYDVYAITNKGMENGYKFLKTVNQ